MGLIYYFFFLPPPTPQYINTMQREMTVGDRRKCFYLFIFFFGMFLMRGKMKLGAAGSLMGDERRGHLSRSLWHFSHLTRHKTITASSAHPLSTLMLCSALHASAVTAVISPRSAKVSLIFFNGKKHWTLRSVDQDIVFVCRVFRWRQWGYGHFSTSLVNYLWSGCSWLG